ncbi:unnamed protein product [Allacma fusca]|uniref:Protein jagunal n=1 Tax=Allacma fusca TaxID=39272 RepID=A0A8J2MBP9_9HEXA|nr:unnamed protein product [Allacma fusca]
MASRGGPMVEGTDGTDFMHRQRVASQYSLSAQNKSRLKTCIFCHLLLFFVMVLKISPVILDRLDIFLLEIEELEIPKPLFWELWWCVSAPVAFIGLSSMRRNDVKAVQIYMGGTIANGVIPVLVGTVYYFSDVWSYLSTRSTRNIQMWQGYPYGLLWYAFLLVALQVHGFSLYFASNLFSAWRVKKST